MARRSPRPSVRTKKYSRPQTPYTSRLNRKPGRPTGGPMVQVACSVGRSMTFVVGRLDSASRSRASLSSATLLLTLDLIGTFVFALSGAASGVKNTLDAFGVGVLAFVAGNGT